MDWIDVVQDMDGCRAVVNAVMNLRVPLNSRNFVTSWGPVSLSRKTLFYGVSVFVGFV